MKLNQYKEKRNNKKIIIIAFLIIGLIGGIILEKTFANFKVQKSFKVIEGNFIYEGSGDIIFAFYNGDKLLTKMPGKDNVDNLIFDKGVCNKGATVQWDNKLWVPKILNLQETKTTCNLYFIKNPSKEYFENLQKERPEELEYDGTDDNNLRFIGSNPDNYVKFNNESWRIIGIMNNIKDENDDGETHLKLIKASSIGAYSWDSSSNIVNTGYGINEWGTSDIQVVLNNNYYKKEAGGICYSNLNNQETTCPNWEVVGLDESARGMVSKVKWNTGTMPVDFASNKNLITPIYMYEMEKSTNISKICNDITHCNDEIKRTSSWTGYVGLMYPSDYGYAISGNEEKEACLKESMYNWNNEINQINCASNSWLYNTNGSTWTITSVPNSTFASITLKVYSSGGVGDAYTYTVGEIYPVIYLNSNVKIEPDDSDNYGTSSNPYRLTT